MVKTRIDLLLKKELIKIENDEKFVSDTFEFCESQKDREKLLYYIQNVSNDRIKVLNQVAVIAIESGTAEGELEEE